MITTLTVEQALDPTRSPEMYTEAGNEALRAAFARFAAEQVEVDGRIPTRDTVLAAAKAAFGPVAARYPEARDTEPEFWAATVVNAVLAGLGLAPAEDLWEIRFAL